MSISIHSQTGKLSPMGTGRWASSQPAGEPGRVPERDQAAISPAGREALEGAQELSPLERALQNTTQEQVQAWMADWSAQHQLEVNCGSGPQHIRQSVYGRAGKPDGPIPPDH